MFKYEVIVYWSEDDESYIAEVPELQGCMADGATYEEAIKNAQVVIAEWIETAKTPRQKVTEQCLLKIQERETGQEKS